MNISKVQGDAKLKALNNETKKAEENNSQKEVSLFEKAKDVWMDYTIMGQICKHKDDIQEAWMNYTVMGQIIKHREDVGLNHGLIDSCTKTADKANNSESKKAEKKSLFEKAKDIWMNYTIMGQIVKHSSKAVI